MKSRLLLLPLALSLLLPACRRAEPRPFGIRLIADPAKPAEAYIEVQGLDERRLRSTGNLQAVFSVKVKDPAGSVAGVPVAGTYTAAGDALRFNPAFPFDPGRSYRVTFNGLDSRESIQETVTMPSAARGAPTFVTHLYPSGDAIPANQLRMYVEFSAPMGRRPGLDFITLIDDKGATVVDPFLPVDGELWNGDRTRFTVFFDPGRQKRGILPNRQMGASLVAGRRYTLHVSGNWPDGNGQPLRESFERSFVVGPPDRSPLDVSSWRISAPREGTSDPLVVRFPESLDHGLLLRAVGVRQDGAPMVGDVRVDENETRWTMTPRQPWRAGRYEVIALGILEDLAGNRIGRAFEIVGKDDKGEDDAAVTSVPFSLAR
jgi:hypothetical protein